MRRQARQARRSGLQPMMVINSGEPFPDTIAVVLLRAAWRYRSELAPLAVAGGIVAGRVNGDGGVNALDQRRQSLPRAEQANRPRGHAGQPRDGEPPVRPGGMEPPRGPRCGFPPQSRSARSSRHFRKR